MRKRKTISIQQLKAEVNRLNREANWTPDQRDAVNSLLSHFLMETNNYHGFNYLDWINGGCMAWHDAGKPDFPEKYKYLGDESKRVYY